MATRGSAVDGIYSYELKSGEIRWGVRWRDPSGRAQERGGFTRMADARQWKRTVEAEKTTGAYRDPGLDRLTFSEWTATWWESKRARIAPATQLQYESVLRLHVVPMLGDMRLSEIRKIHVERMVALLEEEGRSGALTSLAKKLAHQVLASAVDNELIATNPAAGIRLVRQQRAEKRALTAAQVMVLADAVRPEYRTLVLTLGFAGLRPGEAAGLRRRDLDDLGQLQVRETVSEVAGRLERRASTKTYQARTVPLGEPLLSLVRAQAGEVEAEDDPLFVSPTGGLLRNSNFGRHLELVRSSAGLPSWVTPYSLRHTCASLLAARGVQPHSAARLMGHDPAEFLRTYAHLYPGDLERAAATLGAAMAEATAGADVVGIRDRVAR